MDETYIFYQLGDFLKKRKGPFEIITSTSLNFKTQNYTHEMRLV